ncbi:hypothetical protein CC78DRAFT_249566 [Lojkania enalia]|uniref:Transcription factor RfeG n=1 Tax=Lojkania enalia TaxID=147567 RepID=A0A9P4K7U1_9PLEO|nr:hypothetical protein CC78DRAFT_249566 [Didymosphaeria enalia]
MSRQNQWFVPGDGIAREVITADIQRYLGPDALVRPGPGTGENEGRQGYWITAYRTLTTQMISDLKMDSLRWQQEQGRQEGGRRGAYQDSDTHAARQHWGPTEYTQQTREPARASGYPPSAGQYPPSEQSAYTVSPTAPYGAPTYSVPAPASAAPRTAQPTAYTGAYGQPPREHSGYSTQPYAGYSQPTTQDYGRPPVAQPHYPTQPSSAPAPGYYIASDGRRK